MGFVSGYPGCGICAGTHQYPVTEGIIVNPESAFVLGVENTMSVQALRGVPLLTGQS